MWSYRKYKHGYLLINLAYIDAGNLFLKWNVKWMYLLFKHSYNDKSVDIMFVHHAFNLFHKFHTTLNYKFNAINFIINYSKLNIGFSIHSED